MAPIFHLAFPIGDVETAKQFYVAGLGCTLGRESKQSVILGLQGHQLVGHVSAAEIEPQPGIYPRHFGLVFEVEAEWEALRDRALTQNLSFYQQPKHRFPGELLEHRTFFLQDPFGNLLEFKFYLHSDAILGAREFGRIGDSTDGLTPGRRCAGAELQ